MEKLLVYCWVTMIRVAASTAAARGAVGRQHLAKQGFLVAEVCVEAFLAGLGGARDAVDAGPGQAVLGELCPGRCQDHVAKLGRTSHRGIICQTNSFVR